MTKTITQRICEIHEYLNPILNEATRNHYEIYHNSFTSALDEAKDYAEKKGYTVDEHDWWNHVTTGRGRPKDGQTFVVSIGLEKNGKAVRNMLQIQIYNRETHYKTFELNCYVS